MFYEPHNDVFQNQFIVDDVSKIIKEAIENSIGGTAYQHNKVNQWTSAVVESCLGQLTKLQKPYKYIGRYASFPSLNQDVQLSFIKYVICLC